MALLEIKKLGCPVLRKQAQPVGTVTEDVQRLVEEMFETMYAAEGIGLAAPQVGVSRRVIVVDVGPHDASAEPMALINPEVLWLSEETAANEEGCLSLPGISGDVKRASRIRVRALNPEGEPFEVALSDMAARVVQHEIDHLEGVLVIDRFNAVRRNLLRGQLRKLKKEGTRQEASLTYLTDDEAVDAGR